MVASRRAALTAALCFCATLALAGAQLHEAEGASSGDATLVTETNRLGPIELPPGGIGLKWFPMPVPDFHFSLRSISGDIVDEEGNPVPLSEVYLHHWVVVRHLEAVEGAPSDKSEGTLAAAAAVAANTTAAAAHAWFPFHAAEERSSGPAASAPYPTAGLGKSAHSQTTTGFALGAETRRTRIEYPAPFGVEGQDPAALPAGRRESWSIEVHLIDLRGAADAKACLECLCAAFNVSTTAGTYARLMPPGYRGGLYCCSDDGGRCALAAGAAAAAAAGPPRKYYLQYTVQYVRPTPCDIPLRVHFLDSVAGQVEYAIEGCDPAGPLAGCVDTREARVRFPDAGRLVFAVGHQHVGAFGIRLARAAAAGGSGVGDTICESVPMYGRGRGAGDEAGFVVGMTTCTFPGGVRVEANETLVVRSTYSRLGGGHTGAMGLMNIAFATDADAAAARAARGACPGGGPPSYRRSEAWWSFSRPVMASFAAGVVLAAAMAALAFSLKRTTPNAPPEYTSIGSA